MPPCVPGSSLRADYDRYASFNNSGAGFTPDCETTSEIHLQPREQSAFAGQIGI
jgi:hypothetical protein